MIVLRPIMRLMVAGRILAEAFKRRREPIDDLDQALHVGALRTSDLDRIQGRHL